MLEIKSTKIGNGRPKMCVPITGKTTEEIAEQANRVKHSVAEIVEWRADLFHESEEIDDMIDTLEMIAGILPEKILLYTFRSVEEGGSRPVSLKMYHDLCLSAASTQKVDLMDIEFGKVEYLGRKFVQDLKIQGTKIMMSSHDYDQTPEDATMIYRVGVMNQFGADIGKIAAMPHNLQDVLRMMNLVSRVRAFNELPIATISMSDLGKVSRITGEITGSVLTFGSLDEAQSSAPGQIPIDELQFVLETLSVKEKFSTSDNDEREVH
ncbi:type I 3-dehydroquinate dehydratase [Tetragenococcus halophilus]|uniref:type I 3-dehydroquinate dehydratase n=1 Tax=Tetragenococcus halophilus TaxID=51669 RepID=UPI000CBD48C9|nr:type I 3-dehydroquinate dehydratase [Tetragenococcus halophilus]RQD29695.1 type I 3-dehydroquinate dehydratase [Tetragenococcus halophilus subsp. halophilus DSM 20339]GBD58667.1 3-dehydroquinate dehydratase [Tetragenococcus halophilus subsp. halophilus]GMA45605.1 3-dehydroquinate dehydratase [Tetragenococcus halophilus subsp. halophilus DSM 20339]